MSRSNPELINPAVKFFEWKGRVGKLQYYDKDKKESFDVSLPFEFLVLDQLSTITGFSKILGGGFYANEVRSTKREILYVKMHKQPFEEGLYENLSLTMRKGGKYAKSIYIAYKEHGEYVIANIKASGSANTAWITFNKENKVENGKVIMTKDLVQTGETGEFYPPKFTYEHSDATEDSAAIALDKELQIYLNQYLAHNNEVVIEDVNTNNSLPDNAQQAVEQYEEAHPKQELQLPKKPARKWDKLGKEPELDLDDPEAQSLYNSYAQVEESK